MKSTVLTKIFFICTLFTCFLTEAGETKGVLQSIQEDYQAGKFTYAQSLVYQMLSLYAPENLPEVYRDLELEPIKSSTLIRAALRNNWHLLSDSEIALLEPYFTRPSLSDSLNSPSGRFKIHYTTSGTDRTTLAFAQETASTFDQMYQLEVNELGYLAPPSDYGIDGPEIDVYIREVPRSEYGSTTPEQPVPETARDDWTSWIQVDNDYAHTYTPGLDGMRVTAAHEFFHMIHFGYRMFQDSDVFFYELSGVWMEDVAFDDINDYYSYLPNFFTRPSEAFDETNYGLSIWAHYLAQKYNIAIMREIWDRIPDHGALDAIAEALAGRGSNLADELAEFAAWNCFTGDNSDTVRFYEEGHHYPKINPTQTYELSNSLEFSGDGAGMETHYFQVKPNESGVFSVSSNFDDPYLWRIAVAVQPFEGDAWFDIGAGNCNTNLGQVQAYSTIWVLPVNVDTSLPPARKRSSFTVQIERGNIPPPTAGIEAIAPNPFIKSRHVQVEFRYRLSKSSTDVELTVFTENGIPVWQKDLGRRPDGLNRYIWTGETSSGEALASGIYFVTIKSDELIGPAKFAVIN